jgi:hypothetical protein
MVFLLACPGEEPASTPATSSNPIENGGQIVPADSKEINIANITANPAEYEGKSVTLSGEYRGWEPGYGSPPVTRSDWILKDESGGIYITGKTSFGLDPDEDKGKEVTVRGVVKVKNGQAHIEAESVK